MPSSRSGPPVVAVVGASGAGKTTLLEKLIPALNRMGLRVGTVKHHAHDFEMDREGKDSWRHKRAGAAVSVISGPGKIGVVMDVDHDHRVEELLPFFHQVDVVITEGYKHGDHPKIEVFRPEVCGDLLCRKDRCLVAVVTDAPVDLHVPSFSMEDAEGLARFLLSRLHPARPLSEALRKAAS